MKRTFQLLVLGFAVVANLSVATAQEKPLTIGLIGDSTVASTSGWGPAFAKRFNSQTTVLNYAKNGATLESLSGKLDDLLKQNPDFVLIQFGHNDQKKYDTAVYTEKLTSYVKRVKAAGATAVVLSSVTRRHFDTSGKIEPRRSGLKGDLAQFAKAAQTVASEQGVPFLDLHTISVEHHNRIGAEASAAYNFNENDRTHFSPAGADAIASLIIQQLKTVAPEIAARAE